MALQRSIDRRSAEIERNRAKAQADKARRRVLGDALPGLAAEIGQAVKRKGTPLREAFDALPEPFQVERRGVESLPVSKELALSGSVIDRLLDLCQARDPEDNEAPSTITVSNDLAALLGIDWEAEPRRAWNVGRRLLDAVFAADVAIEEKLHRKDTPRVYLADRLADELATLSRLRAEQNLPLADKPPEPKRAPIRRNVKRGPHDEQPPQPESEDVLKSLAITQDTAWCIDTDLLDTAKAVLGDLDKELKAARAKLKTARAKRRSDEIKETRSKRTKLYDELAILRAQHKAAPARSSERKRINEKKEGLKNEKVKLDRKLKTVEQRYRKALSDASKIQQQITTLAYADQAATLPRFYRETQYDWRGRQYERAAGGLSYTSGSDLARSLLRFDSLPIKATGAKSDQEKAIRRSSLSFAATAHYGNGADKLPASERTVWLAQKNQQWIKNCAVDPVGNREWLEGSKYLDIPKPDDPFQFLQAAQAYYFAPSANVPVGLDVSCSGLQVYAYLLRDEDLLTKTIERPQSKYSAGNPGGFYQLVANLLNKTTCREPVTRSQVKAVVTPVIYSAKRGLAEKLADEGKAPTERDRKLAKEIVDATWTLAPGAKALFDWLQHATDLFVQAGKPMTWQTADGFAVEMDNRIQQSETIYFYRAGEPKIPYQRRFPHSTAMSRETMRTGIAPNFIQSWDACWLRSILRLGHEIGFRSWGLTHDGFATDPLAANKLYSEVIPSAVGVTFNPDALAALWKHWQNALDAARHGATIGEQSGRESAQSVFHEPPGIRGALPDSMIRMGAAR